MKRIIFSLLFTVSTLAALATDSTFYFTTTDSVELYVRVAGKGQPCLFVHGGPGSTSNYFEAVDAAPLIEQHMQMIYFDQRGSGRSGSAKNGDYSIARMVKDMEEIRSALAIKKWSVMGHSFGGIIITNYAKMYPASVKALMMIHGTLHIKASMKSHVEFGLSILGENDNSTFINASMPLTEKVGRVHDKLTEKNIWYKLMYRNAFEKEYNDSVTLSVPKFNRDLANNVWNEEGYWQDFTPLTYSIKCPVLVITGNRDYAIGVDHYKSFHFPKQTIVHYIGGHASFQEEPQWFAEKIIAFAKGLK